MMQVCSIKTKVRKLLTDSDGFHKWTFETLNDTRNASSCFGQDQLDEFRAAGGRGKARDIKY